MPKVTKITSLQDLIEWADEFDGDAEFLAVRCVVRDAPVVVLADDAGEGYASGVEASSNSAELQVFRVSVSAEIDRRRE